MTAEEALEKICDKCQDTNKCYKCCDEFNLIKKDLEVLEILKSHAKLIELNSVYMGYPKTIVIAIEPNDDGYEKIKELIDNEIH